MAYRAPFIAVTVLVLLMAACSSDPTSTPADASTSLADTGAGGGAGAVLADAGDASQVTPDSSAADAVDAAADAAADVAADAPADVADAATDVADAATDVADAPTDGPKACTTALANLTCGQGTYCCPPSYDGSTRDPGPVCPKVPSRMRLGGACGDVLALVDSDNYSGIACFYARDSHALIGASYGTDSNVLCDGTSFTLNAGVIPADQSCVLHLPALQSDCQDPMDASCPAGISAEDCARCGPPTACGSSYPCTPSSPGSFGCCGQGGMYCYCDSTNKRWQQVVCDPPPPSDGGLDH